MHGRDIRVGDVLMILIGATGDCQTGGIALRGTRIFDKASDINCLDSFGICFSRCLVRAFILWVAVAV